MNKESNLYTVIYAGVLVIVVAAALAFTNQALKETQKKNEDIDKKIQILRCLNVTANTKEVEAKYDELIKESFLVNKDGSKAEGDAFKEDIAKAYANGTALPVFVAKVDGATKYVFAMRGTGLWGPIWGYLSLNDDKNTVFGTDFSNAGETPGLGAEISTSKFSSQFAGKQIFKNGEFKSIAIVKPGKTAEGQDYVDGISGGTITSQGANRMIYDSLNNYVEFIKQNN
ncbi:MAG: NADH:ubiquinone reductase (Na(+)-transporting) subunit C [Massilibacteroides sp.]|nr:NADH:ubiquinone reductase (Na(+)-transporting) subunit C [Massilibacteroides sp.]MDD3063335.1 NADH:ubiquinone reductase (Na(+)-transporting) subunit C [Massilibacteroides sp.]MDD4116180.1 NADH:ubiquinone reductase (Na(+)-transporting) subunit C [Massilibacteroides sp.]MDD4660623.1 NADH:ubiquinone reductase (Na(+)-transporting) subunit C [Massilibacteroides sp.]